MIKIGEIRSQDGNRRAEIWHTNSVYRILFFENSVQVHVSETTGVQQQATNLAEDYCLGNQNPQMLFG